MRAACVCEDGRLGTALRNDIDRYVYIVQRQHGRAGPLLSLRVGLLSQGVWASTAYRLNHYASYRLSSRLLRVAPSILHQVMRAVTGIHIDTHAHIAPGLKIPHGGRIEVGPVRIGRNCDIYHGVTLGGTMSTLDDQTSQPDTPILGDRVWVGPGAVIAGAVTVGDDASVGANSLLIRDVPARGVVLGVPARLVSRRGSFAQIEYREMDNDDERKVALAEHPEAGPRQANS